MRLETLVLSDPIFYFSNFKHKKWQKSNKTKIQKCDSSIIQLIITFTYGWTCDGATKWCSWWRAEIWSTDRRRRQAVAEVLPANCLAEAHVLTVMVVSVEVTVDRTVFVDVIERRRLKKLLKNSRPSALLFLSKNEFCEPRKGARARTCSFESSVIDA